MKPLNQSVIARSVFESIHQVRAKPARLYATEDGHATGVNVDGPASNADDVVRGVAIPRLQRKAAFGAILLLIQSTQPSSEFVTVTRMPAGVSLMVW